MIYATIVTYNPDLTILAKLLRRVKPQVDHIVVVDNASIPATVEGLESLLLASPSYSLIKNSANLGIAEALTQGANVARKESADYILLLDQDSLPASDMVTKLYDALQSKQQQGVNVAAVGPSYADIKGQYESPFVRLKGIRLRRIPCADNELVAVDHLITSGSLISLAAMADIGDMESQLFIDYVDTEWCLRAKFKGYQLYGVGAAKMKHDLGDGVANFMGRKLPVHSPLRYYYVFRNAVWLMRQPWVSSRWRASDIRRLFLLHIVYSLFVGEKYNNWKMMSLGLWHGVTDKMGKFEDA